MLILRHYLTNDFSRYAQNADFIEQKAHLIASQTDKQLKGNLTLNVLKRAFHIFATILVICPLALAQSDDIRTIRLTGDMFGRSTPEFGDKKNIASVIPANSEARILEVQRRKSGAYAVKVKLTELTASSSKSTAKLGDEVWVYYSQKTPWLNFYDTFGEELQDPEFALATRAKNGFEKNNIITEFKENPPLPTKEQILKTSRSEDPNLPLKPRSSTEGDICVTCIAQRTPTTTTDKNRADLEELITAIEKKPETTGKNPSVSSLEGKTAQEAWELDPVISKYQNSAKTQKMINFAYRNRLSTSNGRCYRYVKRALVANDFVDKYPSGTHAKQAVQDLKKAGMMNLLDNPNYKKLIKSADDAPKGAIIVYENDSSASGDVQIKTDIGSKGGYVSDFYSKNSYLESPKARMANRKGKPYKIVGVFINPDIKE